MDAEELADIARCPRMEDRRVYNRINTSFRSDWYLLHNAYPLGNITKDIPGQTTGKRHKEDEQPSPMT